VNIEPNIFLSYCHKNIDIAELIDKDFQSIGILLKRDVRDVGYMESFKNFMERIRDSGYALMIISDEYLKSINCMYEVVEFLKERDIQNRILLIVLENAQIYDLKGKVGYVKYWKDTFESLNNELENLPRSRSTFLSEELKRVDKIYSNIDEFLGIIGDKKFVTFKDLKKNNYEDILNFINYDRKELVEEIFSIIDMENNEEKDIELEKFIKKNPKFAKGYFYRAYLAEEKCEFKKAKYYYENYLNEISPSDAAAYNNLANLLKSDFNLYKDAKKYYEKAIEVNPIYADAYSNYASLLFDKFEDKEGAIKNFEKALEINPNNAVTHYNFAILYDRFDDIDKAKLHLEKAIELNPDYNEAHYNLASLLNIKFNDFNGAKLHYEMSIKLNPLIAETHADLGVLLKTKFNDIEGAKLHYEKALELKPNLSEATFNLAILLMYNIGDMDGAKKYFERTIELKPNFAHSYFNLAILMKKTYKDEERAIKLFEKAIDLNPDLATLDSFIENYNT